MRILLAEDEKELATWLVRALAQSQFHVDWVNDGRMVHRSIKSTLYDALILDLGLPGSSGHDVLAALRAADQRLPVLVLTARDSLRERVTSLHEGADDFMAKPFEVEELEARLVALIRRARGSEHPRFTCGPLVFDVGTRQFAVGGTTLNLTPRESAVLRALIQRSGEPLSKQEILDRVFCDDEDVRLDAIEVLVHRIRKRLGHTPVGIRTVRGLGYVLESTPDA
ncbi:response regulator [Piscinibacter sp. HJYY11]|uniref:response regulator n=1 Tax=Piscinibacter sp. HJYY11 TaxID=2801333 RepID=UPI00191D9E28|nr:response regulator [Piscinibacter sp. HJYY11]MBL0729434.1 response regulator [Piscinibacter sp. HJYY11]